MSKSLMVKVSVMFAAVAAIIGAGFFMARYATSESEGTVASRPEIEQPANQPVTQNTLESAYINAVYSSTYSNVMNMGEGPAELERIKLVEPKMGGYVITVTIRRNDADAMFDDSAYRFRKEAVVDYTEQLINENITIMQRNDNSEATAFVKGEKYYAIVSVTTTRPHEYIKEEAKTFASSIVWR